jgi:NAD dependent epimerase/dehydratase
MKTKILITGADGFIGSHVVELFVKKGYQVRAFILYNSFNSYGWFDDIDINVKSKIDFYFGDIRNYDSVFASMQGCSAVLHLAALIGIPYSYNTPSSYLETNVTGTLNILQAAKNLKLKKIVLTSTSEVYGSAKYIPMDEKHPINPQSPYAATKVAADALGMSFHKSFNLPITILRPFNTFGPRQSSRAVIPTIINQFLAKNEHLHLGNIYPKRDFTYVEDVASAFYLAFKSSKNIGRILNVGSGFEISIKQIVERVSLITNYKIKIKLDSKRKRNKNSEVTRLCANYNLAKKYLDWKPQFSELNKFNIGLEKTINWFSEKNYLKNSKKYIL